MWQINLCLLSDKRREKETLRKIIRLDHLKLKLNWLPFATNTDKQEVMVIVFTHHLAISFSVLF